MFTRRSLVQTRRALRPVRFSSTVVGEISQKELREKAVAEALAREEEAQAKNKLLHELKLQARDNINLLNKMSAPAAEKRSRELQEKLNALPNQDKVKQLDEELEEFLNQHMKLPSSETTNSPWATTENQILPPQTDDGIQKQIKTTTSSAFSQRFPKLAPTPDYRPYSEQELFLRQITHARQSGSLGSELTDIYEPKNDIRNPTTIEETTIATLLAAGCHLGHAKASWRPSTQPFIYGEYNGIHLIDLNETLSALKRAARVIKGVASKGGIILYVGTLKSDELHLALETAAARSKGYYISKRWIPGTVTNFPEITKQIGGVSRQEYDMSDKPTGREIPQDDNSLIKPDLVVLLNSSDNRNCVNECIKSRIPTIGLCDTDMEPSLLTYPIPCNDDSIRSVSLMLGTLSKAAEEGMKERVELASTA